MLSKKSSKTPIYIIIAFIFVIAAYKTLTNYKAVQKTERFNEYIETSKQALNASDSAYIEAFYTKLCVVNSVIENDSTGTKAFSNLDKNKISADFQAHICSKDFLDNVCINTSKQASKLNESKNRGSSTRVKELLKSVDIYLGLESFSKHIASKKWNGSVKNEISYFEKDQFIMVVDFTAITLPYFNENTDNYNAGYCKGEIRVVNINSGELLAKMPFFAQNDEEIRSIQLVKDAMDDKLIKNLSFNIHKELNSASLALFNKPLKTKEAEAYE
jgi:hypothetical protein